MKEKTGLFVTYVLFVITIFMPWFTYNPKVMGYCWGTQFILHFLIPLVMIGLYLFSKKDSTVLSVLAEIGALSNLIILVLILGSWQEACNINTGFHWRDGLHTAMPTYWISLTLSTAFFVALQCRLFKDSSRKVIAESDS